MVRLHAQIGAHADEAIGGEAAGEVVAVGEGVSGFKLGDYSITLFGEPLKGK